LLLAIGSLVTGKIGAGVWGIGFAALLGYPVALVLGVPAYFFFRWLDWVSVWPYVAAGVVLGAVIYLLCLPPVSFSNGAFEIDTNRFKTAPAWLLLSMICCTVATVCFWLVARPDRSQHAGNYGNSALN
jgi:hypothetical protein